MAVLLWRTGEPRPKNIIVLSAVTRGDNRHPEDMVSECVRNLWVQIYQQSQPEVAAYVKSNRNVCLLWAAIWLESQCWFNVGSAGLTLNWHSNGNLRCKIGCIKIALSLVVSHSTFRMADRRVNRMLTKWICGYLCFFVNLETIFPK